MKLFVYGDAPHPKAPRIPFKYEKYEKGDDRYMIAGLEYLVRCYLASKRGVFHD